MKKPMPETNMIFIWKRLGFASSSEAKALGVVAAVASVMGAASRPASGHL